MATAPFFLSIFFLHSDCGDPLLTITSSPAGDHSSSEHSAGYGRELSTSITHSFPTRRSSDLFLISCLIWLDLVASLPLIKERILVIILLLHCLSLMLGSVLFMMLPLLVWFTPALRIKKF